MNTLSIGLPSTLKSYKTLCDVFFGADSLQSKFVSDKIGSSPNGEDEEVIADESQVLYLLQSMSENNSMNLDSLLD
jgi:hypothetical protein